jgi:hypothetical protein
MDQYNRTDSDEAAANVWPPTPRTTGTIGTVGNAPNVLIRQQEPMKRHRSGYWTLGTPVGPTQLPEQWYFES